MTNLYDQTAYKYTLEEQEVLRDLFTRISTKDLLYGCRAASCKWHALLLHDLRLQTRLQQRANSMQSIMELQRSNDPFLYCDSFVRTGSGSAIDRCIDFIKLTYFKWHREIVMRNYRQTSLRPLFELFSLWEQRLQANPNDKMSKEMYDCSKKAVEELQNRVLLDSNDRMAEKHSAEIAKNVQRTSAQWED